MKKECIKAAGGDSDGAEALAPVTPKAGKKRTVKGKLSSMLSGCLGVCKVLMSTFFV